MADRRSEATKNASKAPSSSETSAQKSERRISENQRRGQAAPQTGTNYSINFNERLGFKDQPVRTATTYNREVGSGRSAEARQSEIQESTREDSDGGGTNYSVEFKETLSYGDSGQTPQSQQQNNNFAYDTYGEASAGPVERKPSPYGFSLKKGLVDEFRERPQQEERELKPLERGSDFIRVFQRPIINAEKSIIDLPRAIGDIVTQKNIVTTSERGYNPLGLPVPEPTKNIQPTASTRLFSGKTGELLSKEKLPENLISAGSEISAIALTGGLGYKSTNLKQTKTIPSNEPIPKTNNQPRQVQNNIFAQNPRPEPKYTSEKIGLGIGPGRRFGSQSPPSSVPINPKPSSPPPSFKSTKINLGSGRPTSSFIKTNQGQFLQQRQKVETKQIPKGTATYIKLGAGKGRTVKAQFSSTKINLGIAKIIQPQKQKQKQQQKQTQYIPPILQKKQKYSNVYEQRIAYPPGTTFQFQSKQDQKLIPASSILAPKQDQKTRERFSILNKNPQKESFRFQDQLTILKTSQKQDERFKFKDTLIFKKDTKQRQPEAFTFTDELLLRKESPKPPEEPPIQPRFPLPLLGPLSLRDYDSPSELLGETKGFFGNVPQDSIEGIFGKRQEITYSEGSGLYSNSRKRKTSTREPSFSIFGSPERQSRSGRESKASKSSFKMFGGPKKFKL